MKILDKNKGKKMKKRINWFNFGVFCVFFTFFVVFSTISVGFCANSQSSTDYYEYATVDTDPGTAGYGTNGVVIRSKLKATSPGDKGSVWFSIRGTGSMAVTLQFKCPGDSFWTDYTDYTTNERKLIEGGAAGVNWRGVVKDTAYTSGSKTFGFDW